MSDCLSAIGSRLGAFADGVKGVCEAGVGVAKGAVDLLKDKTEKVARKVLSSHPVQSCLDMGKRVVGTVRGFVNKHADLIKFSLIVVASTVAVVSLAALSPLILCALSLAISVSLIVDALSSRNIRRMSRC